MRNIFLWNFSETLYQTAYKIHWKIERKIFTSFPKNSCLIKQNLATSEGSHAWLPLLAQQSAIKSWQLGAITCWLAKIVNSYILGPFLTLWRWLGIPTLHFGQIVPCEVANYYAKNGKKFPLCKLQYLFPIKCSVRSGFPSHSTNEEKTKQSGDPARREFSNITRKLTLKKVTTRHIFF